MRAGLVGALGVACPGDTPRTELPAAVLASTAFASRCLCTLRRHSSKAALEGCILVSILPPACTRCLPCLYVHLQTRVCFRRTASVRASLLRAARYPWELGCFNILRLQ